MSRSRPQLLPLPPRWPSVSAPSSCQARPRGHRQFCASWCRRGSSPPPGRPWAAASRRGPHLRKKMDGPLRRRHHVRFDHDARFSREHSKDPLELPMDPIPDLREGHVLGQGTQGSVPCRVGGAALWPLTGREGAKQSVPSDVHSDAIRSDTYPWAAGLPLTGVPSASFCTCRCRLPCLQDPWLEVPE